MGNCCHHLHSSFSLSPSLSAVLTKGRELLSTAWLRAPTPVAEERNLTLPDVDDAFELEVYLAASDLTVTFWSQFLLTSVILKQLILDRKCSYVLLHAGKHYADFNLWQFVSKFGIWLP